nr:hypothetical protein [Tanacetum cinerariifolium]
MPLAMILHKESRIDGDGFLDISSLNSSIESERCVLGRNEFSAYISAGRGLWWFNTAYPTYGYGVLKYQVVKEIESRVEAKKPKKIFDALQDPSWVEAMQDELLQFKIQKVWSLVDCPKGEERIDYDEVFAHVARIEAIRLFLAYASFIGFTVYQMDVKSVFLYGTIDEEVGTIDQTLFIRRQRGDFILVQFYVDDIIFGSSNPQLCREFKALMHEKFQMSAMGELNFFLGLQVLQKKDGIFLSQDKYVGDILKKFGYLDVRSSNTPMDKENPWGKDGTGKDVDLHLYRSMIGSLMYLIASRPDIMFAVCNNTKVLPAELSIIAWICLLELLREQ